MDKTWLCCMSDGYETVLEYFDWNKGAWIEHGCHLERTLGLGR